MPALASLGRAARLPDPGNDPFRLGLANRDEVVFKVEAKIWPPTN